jgi:hypothetical protein
VPVTAWTGGAGCVWDAQHGIGIVGDWLQHDAALPTETHLDGGTHASHAPSRSPQPSTVESAWLSGRALAERLADTEQYGQSCGVDLGERGGAFVPVGGGGFADGGGMAPSATAWVAPLESGGEGAPKSGAQRRASPPRARSPQRGGGEQQGGGGRSPPDQLYVRNVPYTAAEDELAEHFGTAGGVAFVDLLVGSDGRPRGAARVRMRSAQDAQDALRALDGAELGGRPLRVQLDERRK